MAVMLLFAGCNSNKESIETKSTTLETDYSIETTETSVTTETSETQTIEPEMQVFDEDELNNEYTVGSHGEINKELEARFGTDLADSVVIA